MGERTSYAPGTFCWVELSTSDADGARAFYTGLFGWEPDDNPIPDGGVYTMLNVGGKPVGALFGQGEQERSAGVPPHWNSYVSVEDADASASRAQELGATVLAPPFDVMDVGRMAVLQDPTGAVFSVWQPRAHAGAGLVNDVGAFCWNELATADAGAAKSFYGDLFGWTYEEADGYAIIGNAGARNGGIRAQTPQESGIPPNWLVYFTVPSADDAVVAGEAAGGRTLVPAMDIPIGRFAVLSDPQGAVFAAFQGTVDD